MHFPLGGKPKWPLSDNFGYPNLKAQASLCPRGGQGIRSWPLDDNFRHVRPWRNNYSSPLETTPSALDSSAPKERQPTLHSLKEPNVKCCPHWPLTPDFHLPPPGTLVLPTRGREAARGQSPPSAKAFPDKIMNDPHFARDPASFPPKPRIQETAEQGVMILRDNQWIKAPAYPLLCSPHSANLK